MSYDDVREELSRGTTPETICAICPWDRLCVRPPDMTRDEIDRKVEEAKAKDHADDPLHQKMPMGSLLTAVVFAGRDSRGEMCPVFALRMRSPGGRQLAESIRHQMQEWTE